MALNRMRTINEVLRIIQEADPESAITANCIRSLCKNGTVRSVQTGNKTLVKYSRKLFCFFECIL